MSVVLVILSGFFAVASVVLFLFLLGSARAFPIVTRLKDAPNGGRRYRLWAEFSSDDVGDVLDMQSLTVVNINWKVINPGMAGATITLEQVNPVIVYKGE